MNLELYIPIYGNYLQIERLTSEEEQSRSFGIQAMDAIATGTVSGVAFGVGMHLFPTRGNVFIAQKMIQGLSLSASAAPLMLPVALAVANYAVIESAPEDQQRGLWQMFSSGLTGTFGIGSSLNI